jgi:hypothetical protein
MSEITPNLRLPYLAAAQAQKHVTHNEALRLLDAVVQICVLDRDLAAAPANPAEGDRYIVPASPTGGFAGQAGKVAAFQDGAWAFIAPIKGWVAWIADEAVLAVYDGSSWSAIGPAALNPAPMIGVNATADATNRLAVSAAASLFNHQGAGHQIKINKASATATASQLYQTGFSGRAEFGLVGNDDFTIKVSADGATWIEALVIPASTGVMRLRAITKAGLPSAATAGAGALVHVTDESGGATPAFSDGTNWRRVADRAIVS